MSRLSIVILLVLLVSPAMAGAGTVSGQVMDASGRPVERAFVSSGGRSDITDIHGRFRLLGVPDGQQKLQVKKDSAKTEVEIIVGPNTTQHVTLP